MDKKGWSWARLNRDQMEMLREGEETLGADILLAYQKDAAHPEMSEDTLQDLEFAELDESQMECLQGLEENMDSVVVAYRSQ